MFPHTGSNQSLKTCSFVALLFLSGQWYQYGLGGNSHYYSIFKHILTGLRKSPSERALFCVYTHESDRSLSAPRSSSVYYCPGNSFCPGSYSHFQFSAHQIRNLKFYWDSTRVFLSPKKLSFSESLSVSSNDASLTLFLSGNS